MKIVDKSNCFHGPKTVMVFDDRNHSLDTWQSDQVGPTGGSCHNIALQRALGPAQMITNLLHEGLRVPLEGSEVLAAHDRPQVASLVPSQNHRELQPSGLNELLDLRTRIKYHPSAYDASRNDARTSLHTSWSNSSRWNCLISFTAPLSSKSALAAFHCEVSSRLKPPWVMSQAAQVGLSLSLLVSFL